MNEVEEHLQRKEDHPFPTEELRLIMKLNEEGKVPVEDVILISNLIQKYLKLRAYVFHNY
jgi:hypothetical protein